MNLSLSEGGRPASVKNRAWHYCQMAWRGVCTPKAVSVKPMPSVTPAPCRLN